MAWPFDGVARSLKSYWYGDDAEKSFLTVTTENTIAFLRGFNITATAMFALDLWFGQLQAKEGVPDASLNDTPVQVWVAVGLMTVLGLINIPVDRYRLTKLKRQAAFRGGLSELRLLKAKLDNICLNLKRDVDQLSSAKNKGALSEAIAELGYKNKLFSIDDAGFFKQIERLTNGMVLPQRTTATECFEIFERFSTFNADFTHPTLLGITFNFFVQNFVKLPHGDWLIGLALGFGATYGIRGVKLAHDDSKAVASEEARMIQAVELVFTDCFDLLKEIVGKEIPLKNTGDSFDTEDAVSTQTLLASLNSLLDTSSDPDIASTSTSVVTSYKVNEPGCSIRGDIISASLFLRGAKPLRNPAATSSLELKLLDDGPGSSSH